MGNVWGTVVEKITKRLVGESALSQESKEISYLRKIILGKERSNAHKS